MSAVEEAASALVDRAGRSPRIGIVLGSGLGAVADAVADPNVIGSKVLLDGESYVVTGVMPRCTSLVEPNLLR